MNPFWNRHTQDPEEGIHYPEEPKRRTHVFLWFTLILLAILAFDLWMLEASGWLIAGNVASMAVAIWLVLAKMR